VEKPAPPASSRPSLPSLSQEKIQGDEPVRNRRKSEDQEQPTDRERGLAPSEPAPLETGTGTETAFHPERARSLSRPDKAESGESLEAPLTQPATCANCPLPVYPPQALERGLEGEVVLKVQILCDGKVGDVYIEESSGITLLENAALAAVKNWTFFPATQDGEPVPSYKRIRIPFTLAPR
jgi:protein TonB